MRPAVWKTRLTMLTLENTSAGGLNQRQLSENWGQKWNTDECRAQEDIKRFPELVQRHSEGLAICKAWQGEAEDCERLQCLHPSGLTHDYTGETAEEQQSCWRLSYL